MLYFRICLVLFTFCFFGCGQQEKIQKDNSPPVLFFIKSASGHLAGSTIPVINLVLNKHKNLNIELPQISIEFFAGSIRTIEELRQRVNKEETNKSKLILIASFQDGTIDDNGNPIKQETFLGVGWYGVDYVRVQVHSAYLNGKYIKCDSDYMDCQVKLVPITIRALEVNE